MAFASPLELVRLLLQQSDRHPIRTLDACDLQPFDPRFVRKLRNLRVLRERADLTDCGEAVLQVVDGALLEVDFESGECRRSEDALEVQQYDIDFDAICRVIREQSGLAGPPVAQISDRAWRLGRYERNERGAEIYLARQMRYATAQQIVDHIRGAIHSDVFVAIISLSHCDLPTQVARQLDGLRIAISMVGDHLGSNPELPFALNLSRIRLASAVDARETRLSVDRIGRRAVFDGVELSIEPRDFGVLVLLAEEAVMSGGWVPSETISATIRQATGRPSNPEQVDKSISRLRDTFRKNGKLRNVPRNGFIERKSKVGARFLLPSTGIDIAD